MTGHAAAKRPIKHWTAPSFCLRISVLFRIFSASRVRQSLKSGGLWDTCSPQDESVSRQLSYTKPSWSYAGQFFLTPRFSAPNDWAECHSTCCGCSGLIEARCLQRRRIWSSCGSASAAAALIWGQSSLSEALMLLSCSQHSSLAPSSLVPLEETSCFPGPR